MGNFAYSLGQRKKLGISGLSLRRIKPTHTRNEKSNKKKRGENNHLFAYHINL
jgi:hypothetical protein